MDEILKTALLAVVQGITEFLPISSSGHLVIIGDILGIREDSIVLSSVLHAGTLVSILLIYFREIIHYIRSTRILLLIFISSIPAGIVGLTIHAYGFENMLFGNPLIAGAGLLITAGALYFLPRKQAQSKEVSEMSLKDAFIIGFAQCIAILPGVSRSGSTISTSLRLKFKRGEASTYSFIIAIPVVAGATLVEILPLLRNPDNNSDAVGATALILGFIISAIVGYASLNTVIDSVRKGSLIKYSYYCLALGTITLLYQGIKILIQ